MLPRGFGVSTRCTRRQRIDTPVAVSYSRWQIDDDCPIYCGCLDFPSRRPPIASTAGRSARRDSRPRRCVRGAPKNGSEDRRELEQIARLGLRAAEEASAFEVWSEACASVFAQKAGNCEGRLRAAAGRRDAPLPQRAAAADILVRTGRPGAVELLLGIVKDLDPKGLACRGSSPRRASGSHGCPAARARAVLAILERPCGGLQGLGAIDGGASRRALADAVASMPSGQPRMASRCSVSRARLNEPDATWKLQGMSGYMSGEDLLDAADAMVAIGNTEGRLRRAEGDAAGGRPRRNLGGAAAGAPGPGGGRAFVDGRLTGADPATRARLLEVEGLLHRAPSARCQALANPNESRAAARRRGGAPVGGLGRTLTKRRRKLVLTASCRAANLCGPCLLLIAASADTPCEGARSV